MSSVYIPGEMVGVGHGEIPVPASRGTTIVFGLINILCSCVWLHGRMHDILWSERGSYHCGALKKRNTGASPDTALCGASRLLPFYFPYATYWFASAIALFFIK